MSQAEYVKFVLRQPTDPGDKVITLFACNPITAHNAVLIGVGVTYVATRASSTTR